MPKVQPSCAATCGVMALGAHNAGLALARRNHAAVTIVGLPSTSAPIARGEGNLPINMQVITAAFTDHDAIALSGMLAAIAAE